MKINPVEVIEEFLKENDIMNDSNFLGVFFYGSYSTKTNDKNSDLDLILVYKSLKKEVRAIYNYKNLIYIEYFKRSIKGLYKRIDSSFNKRIDDVVPIIAYSKILFSKNKMLNRLQQYTKAKFKKSYSMLKKEEILYQLYNCYKSIIELINMNEKGDNYTNVYSSLVLEKVRKTYHFFFGKSKISVSRVYEIYNNKKLSNAQLRKLPNKNFIDTYNEFIMEKDINNKIELLKKLYLILVEWYYENYLKIDEIAKFDLDLFINKEIDLLGREY